MSVHGWVCGVVAVICASTMGTGGQTRAVSPVTDAAIAKPDPADWLHWRGTLNSWAHSPLTAINTRNAANLQLAWGWSLAPGTSEPGPVVHDGIMYVPQASGRVDALDGATGDLVWEYVPKFERSPDVGLPSRQRSIAIYGSTVITAQPNAHLVALDSSTGKVVWDHAVADDALGYRYTSGPIVANGMIVAGMTGCERYKDDVCFITAHDPATGRELWRVATIARPGEPGGDTWSDLPLNRRSGVDAWIPGSYDPGTGLIYWSTAQAKPWARVSRGTDGDALYSNSTLAIDPKTGKVVWYHQFIPGETHDMDEVFESILVDRSGRRSLFKMGKLGILWQLDRTTGKFIAAHDLGYQTLVNVDTSTGRVAYKPGMLPKPGVELQFCPDIQGVRGWHAMSYDPATNALVIPIRPACQTGVFFDKVEPQNVGAFSWYGNTALNGSKLGAVSRHPKMPDHAGELIAMDVDTGQVRWRVPMGAVSTLSALTTAGGIAVSGDDARNVYVVDTTTGKTLFKTRLAAPLDGSAVTYAVRGKQYIAVSTRAATGRSGGNAIYAFALPDGAR